MKGRATPYSKEELAWIEQRKAMPRKELAALFNSTFNRAVTDDAMKACCLRYGWKTGRTGRLEPGNVPPNKGKKGMPSHPNMVPTQFKKGQKPHTYKGAGHERIDKEGYVWIIIDETNPHTGAPTRPVAKHRWLWEQQHGPIPEDHSLKCRTNDKANCDPSNWMLIPKAMMPRLAGRWSLGYDEAPDELKPAILTAAWLQHQARKQRRKINGGQRTPGKRPPGRPRSRPPAEAADRPGPCTRIARTLSPKASRSLQRQTWDVLAVGPPPEEAGRDE